MSPRREYFTETGERLVVLGADRRTAGSPTPAGLIDIRTKEARRAGRCSVCEATGFAPYELDDSGRCDECRP